MSSRGPMVGQAEVRGGAVTRVAAATTAADLAECGVVPASEVPALAEVVERFSLRVTPAMLDAMGDVGGEGPVGRQFVPSRAELQVTEAESVDPIGDEAFTPLKGVVHRYPDRVLLKPTSVCQVYCRFCFRRETVGRPEGMLSARELDAALDYVAGRPEIWEVILSGGDPLVLSDRRLAAIMARLDAIEHVGVVRFHTRVPVVDPARITEALVRAVKRRPATYVVVHVNHADELTPAAREALARLVDNGIPLLSQSALLRGVNDDLATLTRLMRTLVGLRVKPYYLHHLDRARGTGHFRTTIAEGQALMRGLRGRVSGLCQPTYVLDIPGGHGKVPVGPGYLQANPDGYAVEDYRGACHIYEDDVSLMPPDHVVADHEAR